MDDNKKINADVVLEENINYINADYGVIDLKSLTDSDRKIIEQIDVLLKQLSEEGREYWMAYYG